MIDFNNVEATHSAESLTRCLRAVYAAQTPAEQAMAFSSRGVRIFPEQKGTAFALNIDGENGTPIFGKDKDASGKYIDKTGGHKKASCDNAKVQRAWSVCPDADIEVIVPRGFIVLDKDRHDKDKDGVQTFRELEDKYRQYAPTLETRTPHDGRHAWYKLNDNQSLRHQDGIFPGIDVKVAGSWIKEGPRRSLHNDKDIAELPPWLYNILKLKQAPQEEPIQTQVASNLAGAMANVATIEGINDGVRMVKTSAAWFEKRVAERLAELSSAESGTRTVTTNRVAFAFGQMVAEGAFTEGWAFDRLKEAVQPLLANDFTWQDAEYQIKSGLKDGMQKPPVHDFKENPPKVSSMDGLEAVDIAEESATAWPDELLHPGGLLEEIMDYCAKSTYRSHPIYNLAGAITVLASIIGRKVRTASHLTTNIYSIVLGGSGSGKDAPKRGVEKILSLVSSKLFGGTDIASAAAVLSTLGSDHRSCFIFDEFGMLLKACKGQNSPKSELVRVLTDLYSKYDTPYIKPYKDPKDRVFISWLSLCVLGLTVPEEFWSAMQDGEATNGFLARMLVFEHEGKPLPTNKKFQMQIPQDLLDRLKKIHRINCGEFPLPQYQKENGSIDLGATLPDEKYEVTKESKISTYTIYMTESAQIFHNEKEEKYTNFADNLHGKNAEAKKSIYYRFQEHAQKLALVKMTSRIGEDIIAQDAHIEIEDIQWGWLLAETCGKHFIKKMESTLYITDFEKYCNDAINLIKRYVIENNKRYKKRQEKNGQLPIPGAPRRILEEGLPIQTKMVSEVIDKLQSMGKIALIEGWKSTPKSKRALDLYILTKATEDDD